MQKKITIIIPEDIASDLKTLACEKDWSKEEVVLDVVTRKVAVFRLKKISEKMIPHAQKLGIYTDQDVFDRVS